MALRTIQKQSSLVDIKNGGWRYNMYSTPLNQKRGNFKEVKSAGGINTGTRNIASSST